MKNILKNKSLNILASFLTFVALSDVSTTSSWILYEPEVPALLKESK